MIRIVEYVGRYEGLKGRYGRLPSWARFIVMVAALPGIVLVALSFVALVVSILALLLLTAPVYWLLSAMTAGKLSPMDDLSPTDFPPPMGFHPDAMSSAGRRHVDVKVVDESHGDGTNGAGSKDSGSNGARSTGDGSNRMRSRNGNGERQE